MLPIPSSLLVSRTQAWHKCKDEDETTKPHYEPHSQVCIFQPSNTTYISVLVTVTQGQPQHEIKYFKEPFGLNHVGKNLQHI